MTAYYNEFDKQTAAWLRELIKAGMIAPGVVDERSIEDVRPSDLEGFTQCHFFAGIGVWSYALRLAGWPDDRPVWTGSCPCQPFSAAGKGAGFADERHLWPSFQYLIQQRRPAIILGEQVASAAVDDWIDLVHADLEALGYAFGSIPFPAAGVGAPHIRDRNYWVAHANSRQRDGVAILRGAKLNGQDAGRSKSSGIVESRCDNGRVSNASSQGLDKRERERGILGGTSGAVKGQATVGAGIHPGGLADDQCERVWTCGSGSASSTSGEMQAIDGQRKRVRPDVGAGDDSVAAGQPTTGPTNGYWSDADWLRCRDDKWRPVEPGTFPLVTGASARVVRLCGYGNAVNAEQARAWIETVMAY